MSNGPLTAEELRLLYGYGRAANYLSVGQIYLLDNPRRLGDIYRPRTAIAA